VFHLLSAAAVVAAVVCATSIAVVCAVVGIAPVAVVCSGSSAAVVCAGVAAVVFSQAYDPAPKSTPESGSSAVVCGSSTAAVVSAVVCSSNDAVVREFAPLPLWGLNGETAQLAIEIADES
jgi:hypothetical protein